MIIRRQTDILTDMIDYTASMTNKITDYSVGSVIRSIFDAVSIEGEMLYLMTYNNIEEGIESGLMSAFGFSPKAATVASGDVTIEFYSPLVSDIVIDKGTKFSNGDTDTTIYYETREPFLIPAGSYSATITVYCNQSGKSGNVLSGEISHSETSIYNVSRVYNSEPLLNGAPEETYNQARDRFNKMIESIGKATRSSIIYGALSVADIQLAQVYEHVGYIDVYVGDANGLLTADKQAEVSSVLDIYRAAGIKVNVYPIDRTAIDVSMSITVTDTSYVTSDFKLAVQEYVYDYMNNMVLNSDFIYNDFVRYVLNFDTALIYDVTLTTPTENYITQPDEVIRAGNITINYNTR